MPAARVAAAASTPPRTCEGIFCWQGHPSLGSLRLDVELKNPEVSHGKFVNSLDKRACEVAVFRYGLIAEAVHFAPGSTEIAAKLREQSTRLHTIPYSKRSHVAAETLRHGLKRYRQGGFEALKPRPRADTGDARRMPKAMSAEEVAAYLTHLLKRARCEMPLFEPAALHAIYQATGGLPRRVNLLAHHTLMAAALSKSKLASAEHVQAAMPETN